MLWRVYCSTCSNWNDAPQIVTMNRSVKIKSSAATIFAKMNSLNAFQEWSPWAKKDPNMKTEHTGPESGVGCKHSWTGNKKVGTGSMEIIESVENEKVICDLVFQGQGKAKAGWLISETDGICTIIWNFEGDMGKNPAGRIMGRFIDKFVGPDYESGLSKLKEICE